ncbi:MAG: hypothetical protein K8R99_02435 [Actinomycetia bacterium]|nr:hypothetical protein [Actinomycetes bacterium]
MSIRQRLGSRAAVVVAATVGFVVGGMGLVAASQSSSLFSDDTKTSTEVSTPDSVDDTVNSTPNSVDDDSNSSVPDNSTPGQPLPAPFTETYTSAGGSITVTWNGTAFTLDSVNAATGFTAEIHDQRSDRIRVDFEGNDGDARIEVRISDDDNSLRVRID